MMFISPLEKNFHTYSVKAPTELLSVTHSFWAPALLGSPEQMSTLQLKVYHPLSVHTGTSETMKTDSRSPLAPSGQSHTTLAVSDAHLSAELAA